MLNCKEQTKNFFNEDAAQQYINTLDYWFLLVFRDRGRMKSSSQYNLVVTM